MKYHSKVILLQPSAVPALWQYYDYGTKERNLINDWLSVQPEMVKDLFESVFKTNRKINDPKNWIDSRPMEGLLKKEKIGEYRIEHANVQYRLLGIFGHSRKQAVFLIGCTHKMRVYNPHNCLNTAIKRARIVRADQKGIILYERKIQEDI